jgi:hypothetical protein
MFDVRRALAAAVAGGALLIGLPLQAHATATVTPPNDNFTFAQFLPSANSSITSFNIGGTAEPGEPQHLPGHAPFASIWYRWTAPTTGPVIFRTQGSDFDTVMASYSGTALNALTQLASNDDTAFPNEFLRSQIRFNAVAGTEYHIAVDSFGSVTGHVKLTWTTNDDFADAQTLPGPVGEFQTAAAKMFGATKEPGEPNHAGVPGGTSLWYNWTAPATGLADFATVGSDFDPVLAAYKGAAVNKLTQVAANNDAVPGQTHEAEINFHATAGKTYRIAVDGVTPGFFVLRYSLSGPTVAISDASITEGNAGTKNLVFPITMSFPTNVPVTMSVNTNNGTANGNDFIGSVGSVTIPAGQTIATVKAVIKGDTVKEPNETFTVSLSNISSTANPPVTFKDGIATGTILNDD